MHVTLLTAVGKPQRARPQAPDLPVRPERTQFAESQVSSTVPRAAVGYGAGTANPGRNLRRDDNVTATTAGQHYGGDHRDQGDRCHHRHPTAGGRPEIPLGTLADSSCRHTCSAACSPRPLSNYTSCGAGGPSSSPSANAAPRPAKTVGQTAARAGADGRHYRPHDRRPRRGILRLLHPPAILQLLSPAGQTANRAVRSSPTNIDHGPRHPARSELTEHPRSLHASQIRQG